MKKTIGIILALLALGVLSGCQQTPNNPLVVGKDTERLIDAATRNENRLTLAEMLNAPEKMKVSAKNTGNTAVIYADAEVFIPDAEGISTTRVKKRSFTQQEADKILQYFIGSKDFNNRYDSGYDEMVEQLILFKSELAKETDPEKRAYLEQSIRKFESAGIRVPDKPEEVVPASKMFESQESGGEQIAGYAHDDNGNYFLCIFNNLKENKNIVLYTKEQKGFSATKGTYWYEWRKGNVSKIGLDDAAVGKMTLAITKENAQKMAADALLALGIDNMTLSCCEEVWGGTLIKGGVEPLQGRHAYQLEYVRIVNGVPITYTDTQADIGYVEDEGTPNEKLITGWPYEKVHFIIDDTGIVEFVWESPYQINSTLTTHSNLKSFKEISDIFSKMLMVKNGYQEEGHLLTINTSRARLGLMRVMEKDNPDTALLIPVWDFFGNTIFEYKDDNGKKHKDTNSDIYNSQLTINAIDGTIIDRSLGY
jgi:hypothetical protein